MSTQGSRRRQLIDFEVYVERSFDDPYGGPVDKQVREPRLTLRLGRFELEITKQRRPGWFLNRSIGLAGSPWCLVEWYLEEPYENDERPVYLRSGDWTEYHDRMINDGGKQ